jgi:3-dehydroquinate dehydratase/shikimate dehydrogenase
MPHTQTISPSAYLRSRVGRVCVALQAHTVEELLARAEAALAESHFLEFRLDSLDRPADAVAPIAAFLASQKAIHGDVAAIATCRRKPYGGSFSGSLAAELKILTAAAEAGFALLDLEIESAEQCPLADLDSLRERWLEAGASLLISYHDFESPADPERIFARIQRFHPEFVKIVGMAHTLSDALNLLNWIKTHSGDAQLIGLAMGEAGILSRVLSLRAGSAFTFASPSDGAETAPGQISGRTLKDLYRVEDLDQATRIYGVAGNPVSHSLSPLMQNTAFRRERINAVYLPLRTDKLDDLLALARQLPLSGISVTIPHKQSILPYLANVEPLAARIGACNTLRLGVDGKLYGFNTDVTGVLRPLEKRMSLKGAKVLVLGSGGAARAAVFGLAEKGAQVSLWSRNDAKARALASASNTLALQREAIAGAEFDILINATPCGMTGHAHPLPLQPEEWRARLVFDLVYNPLETPLLKLAKERGSAVIQGVEMFIQQGARQFEIWTGKPAPEAEMQRAVLFALNKAQSHDAPGKIEH